MDYMAKINELKNTRSVAITELENLINENKFDQLEAVKDRISGIDNSIGTLSELAGNASDEANLMDIDKGQNSKKPFTVFNSLGEQLQAIYNAKKLGIVDDRLLKVNNSIKGANESTNSDGGFAVQEDFAGAILESAAQSGEILKRVDGYTCSSSANSMRWLHVDESEVSTSVYGGIQTYWASEGTTVTASKPQFKEMKLDLEKVMGFAYATDEILQDASFMSGFFGKGFTLAVERLLEANFINGDGTSKPLGILKSPGTVSIAKESAQADGTLNSENLLKMYARMPFKNRNSAIWLMHPDLEGQLPTMTLGDKPVWLPEGGFSGAQYQTIFGKPIVFCDQCSGVGTKGDIILSDWSQYIMLKKGTAKQDWSMHVEFLTDQMCFRIVLRCNGAPKRNTTIALKNSNLPRSPFVTLDSRLTEAGL